MTAASKFGAVVAAQVLVFAGWVGYHEHLRRIAPTLRLALSDVSRTGRGLSLRLRDSDIERPRPVEGATDPLYTALAELTGETRYFSGEVVVGFCPEMGPQGERQRLCTIRRPGNGPTPGLPEATARANLRLVPAQVIPGAAGPEQPTREQVSGWIDFELDRLPAEERGLPTAGTLGEPWEVEVIHRPGRRLLVKRLWHRGRPVEF